MPTGGVEGGVHGCTGGESGAWPWCVGVLEWGREIMEDVDEAAARVEMEPPKLLQLL